MFSDSNELEVIEKYLKSKKTSQLLAFAYNDLGEFELCESLDINKESLLNRYKLAEFVKKASEKCRNFEVVYQKAIASIQIKSNMTHEHDDQINPEQFDEDQYLDHEAMILKKQFSNDRHMKKDQDHAYDEMLKKLQIDQKKKEEEDKLKQIEILKQQEKLNEISKFKTFFDNEVVAPEFTIQILLRLPNGQRIPRNFDIRSKIEHVVNYVRCLDDKGFENPEAGFVLVAGFPPAVLEKHKSLLEVFGKSENEMIQVREN